MFIDPELLERLDINSETFLDVTTDGERIVVTPVPRERAVDDAIERAKTKHASTFKKLAK